MDGNGNNQVNNSGLGLTGTVGQPNPGFGLNEEGRNNGISEKQLAELDRAYENWEYNNIRLDSQNNQINGMLRDVQGNGNAATASDQSERGSIGGSVGNVAPSIDNVAPPIGWDYNKALSSLNPNTEAELDDNYTYSTHPVQVSNIYEKEIKPEKALERKKTSNKIIKRVLAGLLALATTVGTIYAASAIQKSGDAMDKELAESNKKAIEDHQAEKDIADYNAKHKDNFVASYDDDNGRLRVIKIESNGNSYESTVKGARN